MFYSCGLIARARGGALLMFFVVFAAASVGFGLSPMATSTSGDVVNDLDVGNSILICIC